MAEEEHLLRVMTCCGPLDWLVRLTTQVQHCAGEQRQVSEYHSGRMSPCSWKRLLQLRVVMLLLLLMLLLPLLLLVVLWALHLQGHGMMMEGRACLHPLHLQEWLSVRSLAQSPAQPGMPAHVLHAHLAVAARSGANWRGLVHQGAAAVRVRQSTVAGMLQELRLWSRHSRQLLLLLLLLLLLQG